LIVQARTLGIGKRELLEEYYPDELPVLFEAWNELHGGKQEPERVDVMEFLNM